MKSKAVDMDGVATRPPKVELVPSTACENSDNPDIW